MTGAILKWKDGEKQTEAGCKQVPLSQYLKKKKNQKTNPDFKLKQVRETINQEDIIIILNIYAPNSGAPDFIGSILLEL